MTNVKLRLLIFLFQLIGIILGVSLMHLNPWFIIFIFLSILPSILRSFEILKDLDERELLIEEKSGNLALIITIFLVILSISLNLEFKGDSLLLFILSPIIFRAVIFKVLTSERKKSISYIGRILGLLIIIFSLLSHGFSPEGFLESVLGVLIIIFSELSKKFRLLSVLFFLIMIILFYFSFRNGIRINMLISFIILSVPLLSLGILAFKEET